MTVANELPPAPTVDVGLSVIVAGGCCAVSVTFACTLAPFHVAVTVAVVFAVTSLVDIGNDTEWSPAFTVTVAGGLTAGELLDSDTSAPPGGAVPFSMTMPPGCPPPLMVDGEIDSERSDGGITSNATEADLPLSVAVIVTGVADATCPAVIMNCVHAMLSCITTEAGTGAAVELELLIAIDAPVGGAAAESCTCTHVVSPLKSGLLVTDTDTGVGGAELIVKLRVADQSVTAAVVGDESPCADRTRQNFVPAVSDVTVSVGGVIWL